MAEAAEVKAATNPHEVLLVADALTGQDAVNTARAFDERLGVTGIVLTRMDGDARGGAALSMRAVTGKPIKLDRHRRKGRRAGGVPSLARRRPHPRHGRHRRRWSRRRPRTIDPRRPQRVAEKMRKGEFDLDDLRDQLAQMEKIGGIGGDDGHAAGHRQDEEPARARRTSTTSMHQAPDARSSTR